MSTTGIKRLKKEHREIIKDPIEFISASPTADNIFDWMFTITGPPNTPFEGGEYVGTLKYPTNYPFAGPQILMITPNGRFQTNARICLSMSDFHPETWNPNWTVRSVLMGLLSFMTSDEVATGAIKPNEAHIKQYALKSKSFNKSLTLNLRK